MPASRRRRAAGGGRCTLATLRDAAGGRSGDGRPTQPPEAHPAGKSCRCAIAESTLIPHRATPMPQMPVRRWREIPGPRRNRQRQRRFFCRAQSRARRRRSASNEDARAQACGTDRWPSACRRLRARPRLTARCRCARSGGASDSIPERSGVPQSHQPASLMAIMVRPDAACRTSRLRSDVGSVSKISSRSGSASGVPTALR